MTSINVQQHARNRGARSAFAVRLSIAAFMDEPRALKQVLDPRVPGELCSRRHGCLIEPTAMVPPTIRLETRTSGFRRCDRSFSLQGVMAAVRVVVVSEGDQFHL
jgi:hypothetical protein